MSTPKQPAAPMKRCCRCIHSSSTSTWCMRLARHKDSIIHEGREFDDAKSVVYATRDERDTSLLRQFFNLIFMHKPCGLEARYFQPKESNEI